jgi:hypothetical protein
MPINFRSFFRPTSVICILVAAFLFFYGAPLGILLVTKWELRKDKRIWLVPKPLPLSATNMPTGDQLTYFGCRFDSPWSKPKQETLYKSSAMLNFPDGQFIIVWDPLDTVNELQVLRKASAKRGAELEIMIGPTASRSRYDLLLRTWSLTPQRFTSAFLATSNVDECALSADQTDPPEENQGRSLLLPD